MPSSVQFMQIKPLPPVHLDDVCYASPQATSTCCVSVKHHDTREILHTVTVYL